MSDNVMNSGAFPYHFGATASLVPVLSGHGSLFETSAANDQTAVPPNDSQFHQKPKVTGSHTEWIVPQPQKYLPNQVANIPPASKAHSLFVHRIERNWPKTDLAGDCLPAELQAKTPWSLAIEARTDQLSSLTPKHHGKAVMLLRQKFAERRAMEAALGVDDLSMTLTTIPTKVGKQPKANVVEAVIKENRDGLTLADFDDAIQDCQRANKKMRSTKAPGETKKDMSSRVKKESRRAKKEVLRTMRSVISRPELAKAPRKRIFQEVEREIKSSQGRPLRKGERKEITKIQKARSGTSTGGLKYSLAASGPAGDIVMVQGLPDLAEVDFNGEKKKQEPEAKPGLSDAGSKYLEKKYNLDTMGDLEPTKFGGRSRSAQRHVRDLSDRMREASISPPEDATMANTGGD